jgi:hypothetical protein
MGKRYAKICKLLGHTVYEADTLRPEKIIPNDFDGVILATPTRYHLDDINAYRSYGKPMLAEKPLFTDRKTWDLFDAGNWFPKDLVRMINQYEYYIAKRHMLGESVKVQEHTRTSKVTHYNYFRSGNDSIIWDCINIVGLADTDSDIELSNDSLVWDVAINGYQLDLSEMDSAYIWNVLDWTQNFDSNYDYIVHAHERCFELQGT